MHPVRFSNLLILLLFFLFEARLYAEGEGTPDERRFALALEDLNYRFCNVGPRFRIQLGESDVPLVPATYLDELRLCLSELTGTDANVVIESFVSESKKQLELEQAGAAQYILVIRDGIRTDYFSPQLTGVLVRKLEELSAKRSGWLWEHAASNKLRDVRVEISHQVDEWKRRNDDKFPITSMWKYFRDRYDIHAKAWVLKYHVVYSASGDIISVVPTAKSRLPLAQDAYERHSLHTALDNVLPYDEASKETLGDNWGTPFAWAKRAGFHIGELTVSAWKWKHEKILPKWAFKSDLRDEAAHKVVASIEKEFKIRPKKFGTFSTRPSIIDCLGTFF